MLSILIPIYNEDVRQLVADLCAQARGLTEFEVLCFDDGSATGVKAINRSVTSIPEVRYEELPVNQGRSRIRNLLADSAKGSYLLFMDCDSKVVHTDFLKNYVARLHPDQLLYGGRCYAAEPPSDQRHLLHWRYGTSREQQTAAQRAEQPYHSFMTNNFLLPAPLFQSIRFDESLTQYGHEDTLFGMVLKERRVQMVHINNPLQHLGLEPAEVFLDKTRKAIENLHQLMTSGKEIDTRLLRVYRSLKRFGLRGLFVAFFNAMEPILVQQLMSRRPSLWLFDLYKLGLLARAGK